MAVHAHADGPHTVAVSDPVTGSSTVMTGALTYGAAASDNIILLEGANTGSVGCTTSETLAQVQDFLTQ